MTSNSIDAILTDPTSVHPLYQPIVDLATEAVVGYEALARWPRHPDTDPAAVFAEAAEQRTSDALDWACRTAAIGGALDADMTGDLSLFINIEPLSSRTVPAYARKSLHAAHSRLSIVIELTERSLLDDPARLLDTVRRARRSGYSIALDDVGSHPDSLALLDFIAPDIIKLDCAVVQSDLSPHHAAVLIAIAIAAHVESTGAQVLAEGIETDDHLLRARALGATLGQGCMFGRPAPLPPRTGLPEPSSIGSEPDHRVTAAALNARPRAEPAVVHVPSDLLPDAAQLGTKSLLLALTRQLKDHAHLMRDPLTIQAAFQDSDWFTPSVAERYTLLAADNPFVTALGIGMDTEPAPGVRGAALRAGERFVGEWTITIVGSHYCAALIARDLGDTGPDHARRFSYLLTHDRSTVLAAARSMMHRVLPIESSPPPR
ncbi:sensor domain-containing phosphodiesterase [Rhodococcoides fascians]|uniref:sensor domain-containing phosphodiesterase n=1 Tax=Rhodococcoides fascians TaxID=1828 RepID=UPI0006902391|nr:EAL domain-containing protein [Rhodococcus fascians]